MSRSGYTDDIDENWSFIMWRGAVASAFRGARGQAFLREALAALDALPAKELIPNDLQAEGSFCLLGAVGRSRGTALDQLDTWDREGVAGAFGIAGAMAAEIMWMNDEGSYHNETPAQRWERMRKWVVSEIKADQPEKTEQPA